MTGSTGGSRGYFVESQRPLHALLIVGAMVFLYEIGARTLAAGEVEWRIVAFTLIEWAYERLGATGRYLPPLVVLATLLAWQVASRQGWRCKGWHLLGMLVEGSLLAIPLVVIGAASMRYLPLMAGERPGTAAELIASIGAGVYEEFIFRLLLFAALHFLLVDVCKLNERWSMIGIILVSAVAFSAYHYLGSEPFVTRVFVFRTLAGVYFGLLMWTRGFAVTVISHSAYDVLITLLR